MKDQILDSLAEQGANIAQFVSFNTNRAIRFSRISRINLNPNSSVIEAIETLLTQSEAGTINIRTFLPDKPDGNPFVYGESDPKEIEASVSKFTSEGFNVILNETIRVNDGGFSGVIFGSLMEGAPNDTPRCVEKPGCMGLSRSLGLEFIHAVYDFHFHMPFQKKHRVEFSVHPHRVGYASDRYIIWQADKYDEAAIPVAPEIQWPNRMSNAMGDKAYGVLMAHLMGLPVPHTTVFGRLIPQFNFGSTMNNDEPVWVRTVPKEQTPGKFQTIRGWKDPFTIMQEDDPDNTQIAAIIIQQGIRAHYSGSAITDANGDMILEGCKGYGDQFMIGQKGPEALPKRVASEVEFLFERIIDKLGSARFEWVYDGRHAWVVQLHRGRSESYDSVIYPGIPKQWVNFDIENGLESLRDIVNRVKSENFGIRLIGDVGLTSHFGDILRKSKVPSIQIPKLSKSKSA